MSNSIEPKMEKLIAKLEDYRPDQAQEIVKMQKTLKAALLKKNFKQHPALLQLLDTLKKRDEAYTLVLSNKEDLTEVKRVAYFERRREVRFMLAFFGVEQLLDSMEKRLDYYLSDEVESTSGDSE